MTVSPALVPSTQPTFTIRVDGEPILDTIQVVSIDVWSSVNRLPRARLVLYDGTPAERDFPLSDSSTFLPGQRVEIDVGYLDQQQSPLFSGLIVKQGLEIDQTRASRLVLDLSDDALAMTLERKNALFENVTDSALIGQLIADNGLSKDVAPTDTVHEVIVQYYASDWDLMVTRAELNGLVVLADGGRVTVERPDTAQTPVLAVEYGESILDFHARMDAATQYAPSAIKSYTWDAGAQKVVDAGPGKVDAEGPGNVSSDQLARVFDVKSYPRQTGGPIEKTALKDWSSAELLKSRLSKIRGEVRFQGNAQARPGKTLELGGLGGRFNGTAYIGGVRHSVRDGKWLTTAELGLSPQWFAADAPHLAAPDASGQLPPIKGLQTGVVKRVAKDPEGELRVLVELPLLRQDGQGVWARLGTFYATGGAGAVFFPEVADEVVVGFMNEDPRYPVILGSVYSKKLAPPFPPEEKNDRKAIVTRGQLAITFDDGDGVLQIETPGGHTIRLDDGAREVSIRDSNSNSVVLSRSGITLDSAAGLELKAKGNITLQAGANLSLEAKANATMEGLQVSHKAKAKFSAQGSATAELKASGILTVQGALVKIN
ncbi:MAG: type VI secretion system tip protein VgrG [Acidobacteriota bacterium]